MDEDEIKEAIQEEISNLAVRWCEEWDDPSKKTSYLQQAEDELRLAISEHLPDDATFALTVQISSTAGEWELLVTDEAAVFL